MGCPHISGQRDADVAFGLAFAHAEDDFPTLQRAVLAARGRLANVDGIEAAQSDYLVHLLGHLERDRRSVTTPTSPSRPAPCSTVMPPDSISMPPSTSGAVLPGAAPVKGQDIVALFMLRLPFFYGLDEQLRGLLGGGEVEIPPRKTAAARALAIAIAPSRSADGATRLLLNPQGPFAGPLSWYEARITSGEGWNLAGGLIPGSPLSPRRRRPRYRLGLLRQSPGPARRLYARGQSQRPLLLSLRRRLAPADRARSRRSPSASGDRSASRYGAKCSPRFRVR